MRYGMFIDLNTCAGCAACVMACKQSNGTPRDIFWLNIDFWDEGSYPDVKRRVLPHACMHCANPRCIDVCPTGASIKREDGIVYVDQDICVGDRACAEACPYGARFFVRNDPAETPYWGNDADLTPYELVKTTKLHTVNTMGKCNFCMDRLDAGKDPMCVHTCLTKCRVFGDLDDPESEVSKAIAQYDAKPYMADANTLPSVFYAGL